MSNYAVINIATGLVENIALWDGEAEWSVGDGYIAVQSDVACIGWTYTNGVFAPPPVIPPTPEEVLAANQYQQEALIARASQAMTPILVALQLGNATDAETASVIAWQAYFRDLKAVDLTVESPAWPTEPG